MSDVVIQCEECEPLLIDLIEGHLSPAQRQVVNDHLAGCPLCRQKREEFELTLLAYHGGETPGPAVRMTLYEAARDGIERKIIPLFLRRPLPYAVAALLLLGVTFLMRPLWQPKEVSPESETTSSLSLPPPAVPDIKIEYSRGDLRGLAEPTWILMGTTLQQQRGGEAGGPFYEVAPSSLDELIREARRLNIIPIPMLTLEPRECPRGEAFEAVTLEFEGRKIKGRLCGGEEGDPTLRQFLGFFRKWTDSLSR